jgi:hypothetical protein
MERKDYHVDGLEIVNVVPNFEDVTRCTLICDTAIHTIVPETDEDRMSKNITMRLQDITDQLIALKLPEATKARRKVSGTSFPFSIIKSILLYAVIDIDRIYKEKGTLRENKKEGDKDSIYTSNLFKTILTRVKVSQDPDDIEAREEEFSEARHDEKEAQKTIVEKTVTRKVLPPFGWGF